jgi:hypothetical protein
LTFILYVFPNNDFSFAKYLIHDATPSAEIIDEYLGLKTGQT